MLVHAQLGRGQRLLDIGCGSGQLLVQAARRLGPSGASLGLDIAPGMVAAARRAVASARLRNVEVMQADAEAATLAAASYDIITCCATLPYMYDPGAALALWRGWLRPSGRLLVQSFKSPFDPECGLFYDLASQHGLDWAFPNPLQPLGDRQRLAAVLEAAGYRRVQVFEEASDVLVPAASARAHAEAMWESSVSSPHHHLGELTSPSAPSPPPSTSPSARGAGGAAAGGEGAGGAGAGGGPSAGAAAAGGAGGRGGGAGRGPGSAAVAAAAAARGSRPGAAVGGIGGKAAALSARRPAPASPTTPAPSTPNSAPAGAEGPPSSASGGAPGQGVAGPGSAQGQGQGRVLDPKAVAAFREAFLGAAERSARARLSHGVVRTKVGVLYGMGHAT
ncbi:hypothetical protein HYH03_016342 [Edaphochlamys debaryana]|uniref:Methyltransferase domain-containing protein n=1 Tax=Edaphochlamys debaryana TaxID=47281 RepID=A0A836BPZ5_9CHLO|nr:hypothetical protein HYH03_016342 [Edaphochlamys debaryana]|eukprot:KAG2484856.1 hypothetical protein HYH03_016342 [Edaphochlamys debaryana]